MQLDKREVELRLMNVLISRQVYIPEVRFDLFENSVLIAAERRDYIGMDPKSGLANVLDVLRKASRFCQYLVTHS